MDTTELFRPDGRVVLVGNRASGRGGDELTAARQRLIQLGVKRAHIEWAEGGGDLPGALDRAIAAEPELLIVGGGDGTVGAAADRVAGTDVVLGVLPLGTANDFARTLEISQEPGTALEELLDGRVVDVDLGRVGERSFLNVASIGLAVEVTKRLTDNLKRRLGAAAYPTATALAYRRHRPFRARLEFPDGDREPIELEDLLQIAIGSGRHYGGGNTIAPTASVDDDLLDLYAIRRGRLRDHLSIASLFRSGRLVEHDRVEHVTTGSVRVVTDEAMELNLDGELAGETPATFRVDRNAFHVIVPKLSRAATLDNPPGEDESAG